MKIVNFSNQLKHKEIMHFFVKLNLLIQSGVSLLQALKILQANTCSTRVSQFSHQLTLAIEQGLSLSLALNQHAPWLDKSTYSLIRNAEQTGRLEQALTTINLRNESQQKLKQQLRKALTYPSLLLFSTFIIVGLLMTLVVPQFQEFYQGFSQPLPELTKTVINASEWLANHWQLIFLCLLLCCGSCYLLIKKNTIARLTWQRSLLRLPLIKEIISLKECSNLYLLLQSYLESGIPLIEAISACQQATNHLLLLNSLRKSQTLIIQGFSFSKSLSFCRVINKEDKQLIAIAEESGRLPELLGRLTQQHQQQVESLTTQLCTLAEPIALILISIVITVILIAIYLPIFRMGMVL